MSFMEKRSMPVIAEKFATCDPVWSDLREEAVRMAAAEPALASFVHATILTQERLEEALAYHLAQKLGNDDVGSMQVRHVFDQAFADAPQLGEDVRADLSAIYERDPAVNSFVEPFLFFKGFHALQSYRITHWLWTKGRKAMALHFQKHTSQNVGTVRTPCSPPTSAARAAGSQRSAAPSAAAALRPAPPISRKRRRES